jgi:hypothetical protein
LQPFYFRGTAMLRTACAIALVAVMCMGAGTASAAPFCKTLKAAGVTVGEDSSRKDAEERLDKEIAAWAEHYGQPANAKNRKMECKVYIELLNEFECNAEATVCRDIPGQKGAAPAAKAEKAKAPAKAAPAKAPATPAKKSAPKEPS